MSELIPTTRPEVLVVEDDEAVRTLLALALEGQGFAARLAADGNAAVDLYRQHGGMIDLVILDVRMPGLDGPATFAALRQIDPHVRCCFMSGQMGPYDAEQLRAMGAFAVFQKPLKLAEVLNTLRELLSGDSGQGA